MRRPWAASVALLAACAHAGPAPEQPRPDAEMVAEALAAGGDLERCAAPDPPRGCPQQAWEPQRYVSARAYQHVLRAWMARRAGDRAGATAALREALVYDPEAVWLRTELADELVRLGRVAEAEEELREVLRREPAHAPARVLAARIAIARDRPGEARAHLHAAIAAAPDRPEASRELVRLELAQGDLRAAEVAAAELEAAARRATQALVPPAPGGAPEEGDADPLGEEAVAAERLRAHAAEAWLEVGREQARRHQDEEAQASIERACASDPSSADAPLALAQLFEARARFAEALAAGNRLLVLRPDSAEVAAVLARLALEAGDLEAAAVQARRLIVQAGALEPAAGEPEAAAPREPGAEAEEGPAERAAGRRELAALLLRTGIPLLGARRPGLALQLFEAAQRLLPGHPEVAFYRALALVPRGRAREAQGLFEEAALLLADASRPWPLLVAQGHEALALDARVQSALARGRSGDTAEALRRLRLLLAEDESDEGVALGLLEGYDRAGRAAEAVGLLQARAGAHPDSVALLFALAAAQDRAGRPADALATVRRVLARQPDHAGALNHLGYSLVERGGKEQLAEAERLLRRAVQLRPDDGAVADSYGLCLSRLGRAAAALAELRRADALAPGDPVILSHLGDALLLSGRRVEAEEAFRRALGRLQPPAARKRGKRLEPPADGEGDPDRLPERGDPAVRASLEAKLRGLSRP